MGKKRRTDVPRRYSSMTLGCIITTAMAVFLALLVMPGAHAGSSSYDLNAMLNEPHPFAQSPNISPPSGPQIQAPAWAQAQFPAPTPYFQTPYSQATYAQPVPGSAPVTKPVTEDTLMALFGLTTASEAVPSQVANSSRAAASAPQIAAAGLPPAKAEDPSFITIGGGWFDFNDNEQAAEFRVEWRGKKIFWIFKPFAGVLGTSDAAIYGYGGFLTDFFFGRRIVVTPSIAAGLYEDGDGKDLGSIIEFRSGLEIGWRFDNRSRLSAMIYHISNASIDDNNPGTEVFSIGYSFPLD